VKEKTYKFEEYTVKKPFRGSTNILSKLFCLATPEYCSLFRSLKGNIKKFILNIINVKGTELENFITIREKKKIIGFCAGYSSKETTARQMKTNLIMRNLLNNSTKVLFTKKIKKKINKLPFYKKKTFYISRNAILPNYHGRGFGKELLRQISKKTGGLDKISLHVKLNNKKAIKFYKKQGFRIKIKKNNYALCVRKARI